MNESFLAKWAGRAPGVLCFLLWCPGSWGQASPAAPKLVVDGQAKALIVVESQRGGLYRLAGRDLQKYIAKLTGARLPIVEPTEVSRHPIDRPQILIGGPEANRLVKKAVGSGRMDWMELKPEGFVLKTLELEGRPTLIIGAGDPAGALYGTYDWLERQGIVFQLNSDIIPARRDSLVLAPLNVRQESPFARRGYGLASCFEHRAIWSYADLVKFIDQMAKLKFNYLIWFWFPQEPYLQYSYRGEKKRMGDVSFWEGGYTLPQTDFGSYRAEDMEVGREIFEKFGKEHLAPDEWQGVQDQDQVFAAAQRLLQRVIHHAKQRNVRVWLAIESLNALPTNLARFCRRPHRERGTNPLPFSRYMATYVCPTDPTVHEINSLRLKALVETYPEAEGYIMWLPELSPVCDHPEDRELMKRAQPMIAGLRERLRPYTGQETFTEEWMDDFIRSGVGSIHLIEKILEARDQIARRVKIGAGGWYWGKAYLLQAFDDWLPKDVGYSVGGKSIFAHSPMGAFGGLGERERVAITELDYDTAMFGLQFHVRLYDRERLLEGARENGATGVIPWLNRGPQETEWLSRYFAEGAWNPGLTPEAFYRGYAGKVFGESAREDMLQAFMTLEEKEFNTSGPNTGGPNKDMPCCAPTNELRLAKRFAAQPNPYDGPTFRGWREYIRLAPSTIQAYSRDIHLLEKALRYMEAAAVRVAPRGRRQLEYLQNRTEAYVWHLKASIEVVEGYLELDRAFKIDPLKGRDEFLRRLDGSLARFQNAGVLARYAARKWTEFADHVSDLGGLYRINLFMVTGTDLIAQFVKNIVNFHHGKPYLNRVAWEKVFSPLPVSAPGFRVFKHPGQD